MKTVQYFSDEYLENCKKISLEERLQFLEDFRLLQNNPGPSKLISIKIPEHLLMAFKNQCKIEGIKYQTQIKKLMNHWIKEANSHI